MSKSASVSKIGGRLRQVIKPLGADYVATLTGISKAQLFRYMNGTDIPGTRLLALSRLTNVSIDWLLSGDAPVNKSLAGTLQTIQQATDILHTVLRHSNDPLAKSWKPSELRFILPLLVLHDAVAQQKAPGEALDDILVLRSLNALEALREHNKLQNYYAALLKICTNPESPPTLDWAAPFCGYVQRVLEAYYQSESAQLYYERSTFTLKPLHKVWFKNLVSALESKPYKARISLLDMGAGSGRFLRYIHMHYPDWFHLNGLEQSPLACNFLRELEKLKEIPKGAIFQENWLQNTLPSQSRDVITSHMVLHYFPYVENSLELGLGKALFEVARILKPGGIAHFVYRDGPEHLLLPLYSRAHPLQDVIQLAQHAGLKHLKSSSYEDPAEYPLGNQTSLGFNKFHEVMFIKTA